MWLRIKQTNETYVCAWLCSVSLAVCVDVKQSYLPEPLDDRVVGAVAILVNSVLSPVVDVDIAQTAHEQLQRRRMRAGGRKQVILYY